MKYKLKRLSEIGDFVTGIGTNLSNASSFEDMVRVGQNLSLTELLGHEDMTAGLFFKFLGAKAAQFANWIPGGKSLCTGISSWWNELMSGKWGAQNALGKGMIVIAILAGLAIILWIVLKVFKWIRRKISGTRQNYSEATLGVFNPRSWAAKFKGLVRQFKTELPVVMPKLPRNMVGPLKDLFTATDIVNKNPNAVRFIRGDSTRKAESVARYIWKNTSLNINECAKIYNYLRG